MYLFHSCITISIFTLLPIDNPHAVAADIGIAVNPILVTDNVIEPNDVAIKTNVSNEFYIVVNVFQFLNFYFAL